MEGLGSTVLSLMVWGLGFRGLRFKGLGFRAGPKKGLGFIDIKTQHPKPLNPKL